VIGFIKKDGEAELLTNSSLRIVGSFAMFMLAMSFSRQRLEEALGACGASLHIPAFTRDNDQLSAAEVEKTRNIANIHNTSKEL